MNAAHETLLNEIRLFISECGGLPVKVDTPGLLTLADGRKARFGTKGVWDILACVKGRFVAIEVKTGSGRLSKSQKAFGEAVVRAGGSIIQARSVDDVATHFLAEGIAHG